MDFIDLKKQQKLIRKNIDDRISNVLNHGQYILGPEVKELENELSLFSKSKYVLCCSSGTDALLLGLISLELNPNEGQVPFYYRVPRAVPSGTNAAINGVVEIAMNTWSLQSDYDTLRFRITIETE